MKKISFVLMLLMASVIAFAQSKTYKVKAGETIESIAHKHGISVSALIQANPQAAENCYTGMTLIIPTAKSATSETIIVKGELPNSRKGKGSFASEIEFHYVTISGDAKDLFKNFNCGMATDFGYRYYLHHNLFIESLFGYRWYSLWMTNNMTENVHALTIPIHFGGNLDVSEDFGLRPFFGPRIDIPVASSIEFKGKSQSAGVDSGVTLEFGLDFQFSNWGIRVKYGLGVGEYKNLNYFSLGATVGI